MRDVFQPETLAELWQLRQNHKDAAIFVGGTDLLVQIRAGKADPPVLISLERLAEINKFEEFPTEIAIGATVNHSRILAAPLMQKHFPVLNLALTQIGSPHIRNMGSIGGNIMTASPAADSLPPLYILDAEVELLDENGSRRRLPLKNFITGPGKTRINQNEILSRIFIPKQPTYNHCYFEKVGLRQALSIAVVSIAALYNLTDDEKIDKIRLAWGSIGPTIVTLAEVEKLLCDKILDQANLEQAANLVQQKINPISDIRAQADYRREVAGRLLLRLKNLPGTGPTSRK